VSARREMVIVLIPSINPDGMDRVVHWYRDVEGTPYETSSLTELYQRYAGHDNNRDWFALSLKETQIVTSLLYQEWFPQVYWDVHQQRSNRERLFVPPFRDPLNPNIDPEIVGNIAAIGGRMLMDLTAEGLTGVATGVTYDMWWNGGARSVPLRHNIIGLLTEAASVSLATPIYFAKGDLEGPAGIKSGYAPSNQFPNPWPGGWWRIGDIVTYEMAAARSLLGTLSREPKRWLRGSLNVSRRAIDRAEHDSPHAWLITTDNRDRDAVKRLLTTLIHGGVEVEVASDGFVADELSYPAGTLVVPRAQPYGAFAKDLFEVQRYPEGMAPYDVSGWTLPMLLGVRRVEVVRAFTVNSRIVSTVEVALEALAPAERAAVPWLSVDGDDTDGVRKLFRILSKGVPGRLVVESPAEDAVGRWIFTGTEADGARADADPAASVDDAYTVKAVEVEFPRVGVYAPWTASMDEGWLRWALDYCDVPYRRVRNEVVRAGRLNDHLDVLILP
ncbi:MAG: peptidase M14, partial [Candidatus Poribacteria bacterium]